MINNFGHLVIAKNGLPMFYPVTVTAQVDNFTLVNKPVQDGGGNGRITQDISPIFWFFVGRDYYGGLPIQFIN